MSEGTKLGEFKKDHEFNTAVIREASSVNPEDLKATKIGEMSEFEKSLYPNAKKEEAATQKEKVTEEKSQKTGEKAEEKKQITESKKLNAEIQKTATKDISFEEMIRKEMLDYQQGDIIKGIVRRIEKAGVLVDFNYKSEGFIEKAELSVDPNASSQPLTPGDEISAYILKLETKDGYTLLSQKRAEYEFAWNTIIRIAKTKETIDVNVTSSVVGGLVVDYKGIKGFIPASQVLHSEKQNLENYIAQYLSVTVLQADRKRRKVIFSQKLARTKPQKQDMDKIFETIEVGQVCEGKVTSIKDFGAFVDIGGVEGLIHISELSWARVNHPSEKLKIGDKVKVFVLGVDREANKISLGMKQLQPDPWVRVAEKYKVGNIVTGVITRILSFGAFIQLEENLEGLIHISELASNHIEKVEDVVTVGQKVSAKIVKLIPAEQKIGLSLKRLSQEEKESDTETDEGARNEDVFLNAAEKIDNSISNGL